MRNAQPAETIIDITGLTRKFASKVALNAVSLSVPRGSVFGLVGENGAGKTTLIRHILGLLRAESGSVQVFGRDPVADPVSVLARSGYLSEQPDLPAWMQVREFMRYTRAFYPKWNPAYAEQMRAEFGLDPSRRIRILSKGQRVKLGLLAAQAHRPDLLLLDEPSSGLDPIVRSEILGTIIRSVAEEGRTVFFSSHLLEEVERVSDHIAMLHEGKVVLCGEIGTIRAQHRRVTFLFEAHQTDPPTVPGALTADGKGREWSVICDPAKTHLSTVASNLKATVIDEHDASLNEIFVAYARVPLSLEQAHV